MINRILAGDMWIVHNFGDPNVRYQRFLATGKPRFQTFFDSLLLYDEIVLPTDDFVSLGALVGVLGAEQVLALADSGSLQLVRSKGLLAYVGNGGGLLSTGVARPGEGELPISAPLDEAMFKILSGLNNVDETTARRLTDAFVPLTRERAMSVDYKLIRDETYRDINGSSALRAHFAGTDLSRLPGINDNQIRTFDAYDEPEKGEDQIGLILRLAQATHEMQLAAYSESRDVSTGNPVGQLLRAKQDARNTALSGMVALKELVDIPATVDWVLEDKKRLKQLLRLRDTAAGRAFRGWIHEVMNDKSGDVAKAYVALLRSEPLTSSLPVRVVRFLATSGWAVAEPISGTIASVLDSFVTDKFLASRSPKFFIDRLTQLGPERLRK